MGLSLLTFARGKPKERMVFKTFILVLVLYPNKFIMTTVAVLSKNFERMIVTEAFVRSCTTLADMLSDIGMEASDDTAIPIPGLTAGEIQSVNAFYTRPQNVTPREYFACKSTDDILSILTAADYLQCNDVLDSGAAEVASRLHRMTRGEMYAALKIENDFTQEEEMEVKAECSWAFY